MKRFIVSILFVAVFFIGLGALVENVGAKFKSDEKALELIRQARAAIGGDAAIAEVRSMTITGRTTHTFKTDGIERTETGETEIAMQLPDKLMKMVKIGNTDGSGADKMMVSKHHDIVVINKSEAGKDGVIVTPDGTKKFVIKRHDDGDTEVVTDGGKKVIVRRMEGDKAVWNTDDKEINSDGKRVLHDKVVVAGGHGAYRQNELLRTTLSLLLSAPDGMDVSYTFAGEGEVDGTAVNIVNAAFGGSNFKLHLSKSTNMPIMLSYTGHRLPKMFKFNKELAAPADGKDTVIFTKKLDGNGESAEFQVRFSDYRSSGGVQLPYKWTTNVAGVADEVFDVTAYEINPANIADKFQNQKVYVRKAKPVEN